jgi:hypothetical protein
MCQRPSRKMAARTRAVRGERQRGGILYACGGGRGANPRFSSLVFITAREEEFKKVVEVSWVS